MNFLSPIFFAKGKISQNAFFELHFFVRGHKMQFLNPSYFFEGKLLQNAFCEFIFVGEGNSFHKMHFLKSKIFCEGKNFHKMHLSNSKKIMRREKSSQNACCLREICKKI